MANIDKADRPFKIDYIIIFAVIAFVTSIIMKIRELMIMNDIAEYNSNFKDAYDNEKKGMVHGVASSTLARASNILFESGNEIMGLVASGASVGESFRSARHYYEAKKELIYSLEAELYYVKDFGAVKYGDATIKLQIYNLIFGILLYFIGFLCIICGIENKNTICSIIGAVFIGIFVIIAFVDQIIYSIFILKVAIAFRKHLIN